MPNVLTRCELISRKLISREDTGPEKTTMEEAFVFALDRLGYEKLREEQEKVLRAFVGGRDVFAGNLWA